MTKRATSPIIASAESSIFVEGKCRRCTTQRQRNVSIFMSTGSWREIGCEIKWASGGFINWTLPTPLCLSK